MSNFVFCSLNFSIKGTQRFQVKKKNIKDKISNNPLLLFASLSLFSRSTYHNLLWSLGSKTINK